MKKKYKILITILLGIIIFIAACNIAAPAKVVADNPFVTNGLPMVCAHRGGKNLNPENTLKAYKACVNELKVDILETDVYLTKDNYLVLSHDEEINRTSDVEIITGSNESYKIIDHTLEELRYFNYGYNFQLNGEYPYRDLVEQNNERVQTIFDNELNIVTIDEFFSAFYEQNPNLLFIIEIKNAGELGYKACEILNSLLTNKYPLYLNRVVIGTFNDEIESHLKVQYSNLLRGASPKGATAFIVTEMFRVNLFDMQSFACLQLPTEEYGINLTKKHYIKRAHRRNIAVQYWTINDEKTMRLLIENGCDAIITDDPILLKQVLNEYQ